MKDEAKIWLDYSKENLESAKVLLSSDLFNPCLQNAQQSVEKALKAVLIQISVPLKKTHDILVRFKNHPGELQRIHRFNRRRM
ncbi:HEPN domain-containing protein [candidate division KSB1 bacterium]|nr:HEPN domain-containing protein [candidate division KSB1 bacterium]NIR72024.1 HEPN domain-containing protein [candidate division KSB1 bacterium]NIS26561.1 HEPN domain-containing protein [candidate division KSB1 bacterium]NIT73323.1 HEPN domain-containing protein [candidate division KSB1 bacterium]NIU27171.1 HEPN domain-containing protein [candidate division KSB1 bacterium]